MNNTYFEFEILNNKTQKIKGTLDLKDLKWTLNKKQINENFKIGDVIFVKQQKTSWSIKQYPKVNGGIIVLDPSMVILKLWQEVLILSLVNLTE